MAQDEAASKDQGGPAMQMDQMQMGNANFNIMDPATWFVSDPAPGHTMAWHPMKPESWMAIASPDTHNAWHMAFMNPANYMQFMQPQFVMEFMNPQNWMAWMNPSSYQVMMDPRTWMWWMSPQAYVHAVNPSMYAHLFNANAYMPFFDPNTYGAWTDPSSYTLPGDGEQVANSAEAETAE
jgi:hypothetical protein